MPEPVITVRPLAALSPEERRRLLARSSQIFGEQTRAYARSVLDDVARDGDAAVAAYTERWDRVAMTPDRLAVTRSEFDTARRLVDGALRDALMQIIGRVRRFNEWLKPPSSEVVELEPGITVGVQRSPVRSAGLYVPSAKGSFPSTMIMLAAPALVAGVEEIAVVVPPRPDGTLDPAVLVAADLLGVSRIFRCNGPAGVAAMTLGTPTIPRTDVIVGPGNPIVAGVQLGAAAYGVRPLVLLGPSEAIILADGSADPELLAADLLNEAEHGGDSSAMLLATERDVADRVVALLPVSLDRLPEPRRTFARQAIGGLGGVFYADLDQAIDWINAYAPEHVQLAVSDAGRVLPRIRNAGEILLGQQTPFAAANYAIGVPHALPTGGSAAASSGVSVLAFLKTSYVAGLTADGFRVVAPVAERLGTYEGFPAHVQAIVARAVRGRRMGPS